MIRAFDARFVQAAVDKSSHVAEYRVLVLPGLVAVVGHLDAAAGRVGHVGVALPDHHQPRGVGVGKRFEDDGIDDAEDSGVGPDTNGENRYAGEGIAGAAPEHAEGVEEIRERCHLPGNAQITCVSPHPSTRTCQAHTVLKVIGLCAEGTEDHLRLAMKAITSIVFCLFWMLALPRTGSAADAEGCTDLKLLPRLEGCVIQECSAKQHETFETADVTAPTIDANINTVLYSCPASMGIERVKRELDAAVHKAGFVNVVEDKDANNVVVTTRKGSHWIRWGAGSEDGATSYSLTTAAASSEKFKPEACAEPQVLSLERTCEIVECTSKSEYSVGMRTAQKEQTSVAGTVQTVTLACPAIGSAQTLTAAEDELKRSGFEILFSDHDQPENGWLTGRAGKHWVELVSAPDGESVSYALTSIAAGDAITASGDSAPTPPPADPAPVQSASIQSAPVETESNHSEPIHTEPIHTASAPVAPVAVAEVIPPPAAPATSPAPEASVATASSRAPVPAPIVATPAAAPTGSLTSPRPIVKVPIAATHDLIWSITGSVTINLLVDVREDGTVANATLAGRITGDVLKLETAAMAAVYQWRFEPARQDGRAVAAGKIPVQLRFQGRPWQY